MDFFFDKATGLKCCYLNTFEGAETGTLRSIDWDHQTFYAINIRLHIDFDDFYAPDGSRVAMLTINKGYKLGERLSNLDLERFVNEKVLIRHSGSEKPFEFFYMSNGRWHPFGIIFLSTEVSEEEENEIWKYYQQLLPISELSNIFNIEEEPLRAILEKLLRHKTNNTPIDPKGIRDFITPLSPEQNVKYIVGAYTNEGATGEWMNDSDSEFGPILTDELLTEIIKKPDSDILQRRSSIELSITNNKVLDLSEDHDSIPLEESEKKAIESSLDSQSGFFYDNYKRLGISEDTTWYIWIRLEDIDKTGNFNSYYYAASNNNNSIERIKSRSGEFLRYIMYLKSKLAFANNQLINQKNEDIRRQSIRSAIAFIMSRNMSHNLGSHFLYYTKEDLWHYSEHYVVNEVAPYLRGASKAIDYIQGRMSYLAAVTSDDILPYNSINFKTQIYDNINIDSVTKERYKDTEAEKRINNFLFKNIVRSESYSRSDVVSGDIPTPGKLIFNLTVWDEFFKRYLLYDELNENQVQVKNKYDSLELAMPGGLIGVHAFYNILENYIRNSAKYQWGNTSKPKDLIITIQVKLNDSDDSVEFEVFDNKYNATSPLSKQDRTTLYDHMQDRLEKMTLLEEDLSINQEDKGLKEMLLSSLWLHSNQYRERFSEKIKLFNEASRNERRELLREYGFVFTKKGGYNGQSSLGIKFCIPLFLSVSVVNTDNKDLVNHGVSDIVCLTGECNAYIDRPREEWPNKLLYKYESFLHAYPRSIWEAEIAEYSEEYVQEKKEDSTLYKSVCALSKVSSFNLGHLDQYVLNFNVTEPCECFPENENTILYETHINNKGINVTRFRDCYNTYAYVDSISGENYTKVLEEMFCDGLTDPDLDGKVFFKRWSDCYLSLKIKEAAMTRITIIDERIFNSINWEATCPSNGTFDYKNTAYELSLKNIRVLNYFRPGEESVGTSPVSSLDIFRGNKFRPFGHFSNDCEATDFVSIHVSLIEKMLKEHNLLERDEFCGLMTTDPLSSERVGKFMDMLRRTFSSAAPERLRICIHSGRGKLNEKLAFALKGYPLLNFQSLENSFHNSKFLLSQLFYNQVYRYYILKNDMSYEQNSNNN